MSNATVNRSHRTERQAPAVGRLPGHSRRRHRLRHPRRHPRQLGRGVRLHRRAARRHRRRRLHRLLLRHHHRRRRRRQDRLRQADRRGVPVPRAVGRSSRLRRPQGQAQATAYMFLYLGTFVFALGERHARSGRQPAGRRRSSRSNRTHYLNILHASWPAGLVLGGLIGWILGEGMQVSWKVQLGLFLVPTVLYGFAFFGQPFPKSEASAKGLSVGQMLQEVGILGALVACFLLGLFFKDQLGGILAFFTGSTFFASTTWSLLCWAVAVGAAADRRHQDQLLGRLAAAVRAVRDPRARRRGRARHRRLDSEHHRQHPDAGAGQDPLRLHVAADVLAALLRRLHREDAEALADRPAVHLLRAGGRSACGWSAASRRSPAR